MKCTIWYMQIDYSVEIDATAAQVWTIYADVERWPEWTTSVLRVVALDGPGIAVGKHFEIKQPRFPNLIWEVTEVADGTSWVWRQRSLGGTTLASHEIVESGTGGVIVRQRIEQSGPVGRVVGVLTRRIGRRYLELEAQGLKSRSETKSLHDAPRD